MPRKHADKDSFAGMIAVITAILATIGALFAYMGGATQANAGLYKNNAAIKKTEASNQWNYYQAKERHRAQRPVVDVEATSPATALTGRVNEPASTTCPAFQRFAVRRDLVGQPGHAGGRVVQHRGGQAGFLDHAVLEQHGADPAQVHVHRPHRPAAQHDAGVGGEVADGVEHLAHGLGVAVELLDARVDDLDRRRDVVGGDSTSNSVTPGPFSGLPRMKASSTSTRGAMKRSNGMSPPCAKNMSSISGA
jgi:hypothetical protein